MANTQRVTRVDLEQQVVRNVEEYGWHAVNIIEDNGCPPWTFSIGLYETYGFPELIIIGRSRTTAHHILETIADRLEKNQPPDLALPNLTLIPGVMCLFHEVLPRYYADYVGFALWFYRKRQFPLYQIVWPDHNGTYPFDKNAPRAFKDWQPVLSDLSNLQP